MRVATLFLAFCLWMAGVDAQSPWPRSKAGFYTQLAWHFIPEYDAVFVPEEESHTMDRALSEGTLEWYGEYGINSRLTVTGVLPVRFLKNGEFLNQFPEPQTEEGELSGIGNVRLGMRYQLNQGSLPITATLRFDMPASKYNDATGLRTGYDAFTMLPMISTGQGYEKFYWFIYGGMGIRGNGYSEFLDFGAECGARFGPVWIMAFSQLMQPLYTGDILLPQNNLITSLYVDNQGWLSFGLKSMVEFNRFWGAVVSFAGAANGQWVPTSPGIGAGVYFRWD